MHNKIQIIGTILIPHVFVKAHAHKIGWSRLKVGLFLFYLGLLYKTDFLQKLTADYQILTELKTIIFYHTQLIFCTILNA